MPLSAAWGASNPPKAERYFWTKSESCGSRLRSPFYVCCRNDNSVAWARNIHVFPIKLPALRDRPGDIPLLVQYLVERYAQKAGKRFRRVSKETLDLFEGYPWPGNVRELQNVIERAVILCEGAIFSVEASWLGTESPRVAPRRATLGSDIAGRERAMIENALREASGRVSGAKGAAEILGMPRQTLESKMKRVGIVPHRFKGS